MEILLYAWTYGAPILAVIYAWFSRSLPIRLVMAASAVVSLPNYTVEFWTQQYLGSIGCKGNGMKGLDCPDWTLLARIAGWLEGIFLWSMLYIAFIFPFVLGLAVLLPLIRSR